MNNCQRLVTFGQTISCPSCLDRFNCTGKWQVSDRDGNGIVGYLTSHEAYCLWVGYHFQVIIYTHEDEAIWSQWASLTGIQTPLPCYCVQSWQNAQTFLGLSQWGYCSTSFLEDGGCLETVCVCLDLTSAQPWKGPRCTSWTKFDYELTVCWAIWLTTSHRDRHIMFQV